MTDTEAPNWLSVLEKKRENRLKPRLGHEAGAGAPCIKCDQKCPGLDLHFWRKICKNCKCSKEDHDVHDDDVYGWAHFELLGSKPNKINKKIILPGKKDEVELEWVPKGNVETIDKYINSLDPTVLPIKGSQAAQDRKQMLQKQIPIHDLDPTLCHDLTSSELTKMQDYIKHMKANAGVGQLVQYGLQYASKHIITDPNMKILSDKYQKEVPSIETVQLLSGNKSSALSKQMKKLEINQNVLDIQNDSDQNRNRFEPNRLEINEVGMTPSAVKIGAIRDISYEMNTPLVGEQVMVEDVPEDMPVSKICHKCAKPLQPKEFGIFVEKSGALYHSSCFKCQGCNQSLADFFYFYDKETDSVYCGRDFAKIRGIPRCQACDELIFVKEYCLAENSTFHLKHFCCYECDVALAGQNYLVEDSQPLCLNCYEKLKAAKCLKCLKVIGPDEQGVALKDGVHFHLDCFECWVCKKSLLAGKLLFKNEKLYCSHDCFQTGL